MTFLCSWSVITTAVEINSHERSSNLFSKIYFFIGPARNSFVFKKLPKTVPCLLVAGKNEGLPAKQVT